MAQMDPDSRQRPSSQQPEAGVVTVQAPGLCQVSGDGTCSRKFLCIRYYVSLLLFLFYPMLAH